MNPKIAKCWNEALKSFDDAKVALKNGQPDSDIIKKLWMAIYHGQNITKLLETGGEESLIAAGTAIESLSQLERLNTRQAFDKVLQALREYRNLVPDEYNLPLPTGLDK